MKNLLLQSALLLGVTIAASGCATAKGQAAAAGCRDDCNLEYMTCLEAMACMDVNGQRMPCEEECGQKKNECFEGCG